MSDFHQTGVIATLHRLGNPTLERIESELREFSADRPLALALPALHSEFEGKAMPRIVDELAKVEYLKQVVLVLGKANQKQFEEVKKYLSPIRSEIRVVNVEGRGIKEILDTLERNGLSAGPDGKGRSVWLAFGYILATAKSDAIALHDCDILTYNREMLARLCYPVVSPNMDYVYCKGFYSRVTDRMHGRVTRLLITPLVRSLQTLIGGHDFLAFLDSFRYPLAGEFCMTTDLARVNRIPWDWGLEVGSLAEVYRNYSPRRICQVDIAGTYEHKHQLLSASDPTKGLSKMTVDICKSIFRTLASEGVVFSDGLFRSLTVAYLRQAEDSIAKFEADAAINGLLFDRHEEAQAVEVFVNGITLAAQAFVENPLGTPLIPNWNRVTSAIPGILGMLRGAVEEDND